MIIDTTALRRAAAISGDMDLYAAVKLIEDSALDEAERRMDDSEQYCTPVPVVR